MSSSFLPCDKLRDCEETKQPNNDYFHIFGWSTLSPVHCSCLWLEDITGRDSGMNVVPRISSGLVTTAWCNYIWSRYWPLTGLPVVVSGQKTELGGWRWRRLVWVWEFENILYFLAWSAILEGKGFCSTCNFSLKQHLHRTVTTYLKFDDKFDNIGNISCSSDPTNTRRTRTGRQTARPSSTVSPGWAASSISAERQSY